MKLLFLVLLVVFPLGQLLRVSIPGTGIVLQANDFVVASVVLFYGRKLLRDRLFYAMAAWVGVMLISLVANIGRYQAQELTVAALYPIRWAAYAGLYFVFLGQSKDDKEFIKKGLLIGILFVAISGIIQFIFLPDVSFLAAANWDDHYFRLIGTFLDPGFTGAILVFGLIIFYFVKSPAIAIVYLAMMLTFSRASYLMYLVSFGIIAIARKSVRIFLLALLILLLTIPFLPKSTGEGTKLTRENSIEARINNWRESIEIWSQSPFIGVGYDAYRYVRGEKLTSHSGAGADSSLLLVLATTGIVGLTTYIWLLWQMWIRGRKSIVFMASFGAIIVHSFFNNTLFYPWVMEWLWILLAIV